MRTKPAPRTPSSGSRSFHPPTQTTSPLMLSQVETLSKSTELYALLCQVSSIGNALICILYLSADQAYYPFRQYPLCQHFQKFRYNHAKYSIQLQYMNKISLYMGFRIRLFAKFGSRALWPSFCFFIFLVSDILWKPQSPGSGLVFWIQYENKNY